MLSLMLGLVVTGLSVAREREVGTFDQLLVSPATPTEIALAKLVPGCIVGLVHGTIFLLITVFGFGVPFTGSVALLYLAMLIFAVASGGVGLMVSSLSSTQQQAFLGAFTVGVPCILISGAVTPIINMPVFLQHASQLNPLRHFTVISQGVFAEGHHLCGGGPEPGQDHPDQHGRRGRGRMDVQAPDVSGPHRRVWPSPSR